MTESWKMIICQQVGQLPKKVCNNKWQIWNKSSSPNLLSAIWLPLLSYNQTYARLRGVYPNTRATAKTLDIPLAALHQAAPLVPP
jgi:hypothetical protein